MEWKIANNRFTIASVDASEPIGEALTTFCQHIKDVIVPKNAGIAWNYLRIEIWADSGRLIAFPASTATAARIERAGCQVVFATLLAQYEQLADSHCDDAAFTLALVDVERRWSEQVVVAARQVGLSGLDVHFWAGGGEKPILEVQV